MECSGEGTDWSRRTCRNRGHIVNSVVKNLPANTGDVGLTPGLRRSPAEGNGNPFQCCCLAEEPGGLPSTQSQKSQTATCCVGPQGLLRGACCLFSEQQAITEGQSRPGRFPRLHPAQGCQLRGAPPLPRPWAPVQGHFVLF